MRLKRQACATLATRVNTFGQDLLKRYGTRVHKIALDAGLTCPNRDGTKGTGGCSFCNNASFNPATRSHHDIPEQMAVARRAIARRTRARHFIAYFQTYSNTYADTGHLEQMYRAALAQPDIVGIAVGTRPDCVTPGALDLLRTLQEEGREVWLELGLQSAFDATLERVRRGHTLAEYRASAQAARARGIPLCTHLIVGLPGEDEHHVHTTLDTVLDIGVDGIKLHPLHVVRHTLLAWEWRRGHYLPLTQDDYIRIAADLIERTPTHIVFHRVTATASDNILLAPQWCARKWSVLNGIERELRRRGTRQGCRAPACPNPQEASHVT